MYRAKVATCTGDEVIATQQRRYEKPMLVSAFVGQVQINQFLNSFLDFEGEIADLEKAIELSRIDNALNREYNDDARN